MQNLFTALTFKCGHISNSDRGSLSSPGAGSHTDVVCCPWVQSVQSVGNTLRSVLYWHNPVLCTWTLRYIAHLFMVGGRMEGRKKRRGKGREKSKRNGEARKEVEEGEKRKGMNRDIHICIIFPYLCCCRKVHTNTIHNYAT